MSDSVQSESSPPAILPEDSAPPPPAPPPPAPAVLPDVSQIVTADWPTRTPALATGSRTPRYQAVVRQSVLDAIHGHGKSCTSVEVCGVLVGNIYQDEFGPYLHVNSSIRGDRAKGHAAQVTFTAETWSAIQATMDQEHGDERIVGWYHTHPGFGIFLSGMDLFIQDHFFNLPWQVAFVYDPLGGDEGMFYWKDGKADRQPFLIEADHLLITSDHSSRETAPTLAEVEAAELASGTQATKAQQSLEESLRNSPKNSSVKSASEPVGASLLPPPPPTPPMKRNDELQNDPRYRSWSGVSATQPRRSMMPIWFLGAAAFVVSFACTLWAMFSINNEIIVIPHHVDHAATQPQPQSQSQPQTQTPDHASARH